MVGLPPSLSAADDRYIRSRYVNLAWVALRSGCSEPRLRAWQARGLFPRPTYRTLDGGEWYPRTYAGLVRRAVQGDTDLRALFRAEYCDALEKLRASSPDDYRAEIRSSAGAGSSLLDAMQSNWEGFVSGEYGACLRVPWVPFMLRKGKMIERIERLVAAPRPDDARWRDRLRRSVSSLDRVVMPFAAWDRVRFGKPVSRDTHIDAVRRRFPEVFDLGPNRGSESIVGSSDSLSDDVPC